MHMMSDQINELATALVPAHTELENPHKGKDGYGYKYASLPQIIDITRPILARHGLCVLQSVTDDEGGYTCVSTMLLHVSGQYIQSTYRCPPAKLSGGAGDNPVQCLGSSISYCRRYAVLAILFLAGEEDNDAAGLTRPQQQPQQQQQLAPISPAALAKEFHRMGEELHGEYWASIGPALIIAAAGGNPDARSTDLTAEQLSQLCQDLHDELATK